MGAILFVILFVGRGLKVSLIKQLDPQAFVMERTRNKHLIVAAREQLPPEQASEQNEPKD
jgi:hypothetical protein